MRYAFCVAILCPALWAQTKQTTPAKPSATTSTKAAPGSTAPKSKATAKTAKATTKAKQSKADLLKPATLNEKAPAVYLAKLETTKGNIVIRVTTNWAPTGAGRFYNLVKAGFYDNTYFFRVLDFMAQFGMSSDPAISRVWGDRTMFDDRPIQTNARGMVTFAASGQPNSRSTQVFINKMNNARLDHYGPAGFAPFGEVVEGMEVVDQLYAGYGEESNDQAAIGTQGAAFLNRYFPRLDRIIKASIMPMPQ